MTDTDKPDTDMPESSKPGTYKPGTYKPGTYKPGTYKPGTPEQLIELIQWAAANNEPLAVRGRGGKAGIGRPFNTDHILDLSGFSGVSQYDPVELVLTAGAGTPLGDIHELLAEQNQMLAFEPPDYSAVLGVSGFTDLGARGSSDLNAKGSADSQGGALRTPLDGGSLGGTLAGNISGPRRFFAGAARDHFLGFKAVSGRGEPFKSGGRVVKNVTGFDLSKLMAGSWGTLGALWEVTVKVLPRPEKTRTLLIAGLDAEQAGRALIAAASSPHSISGGAYLPAALASRSQVGYVASANGSVTAVRLEGPGPSVDYRLDALKALLGSDSAVSEAGAAYACDGDIEELHYKNSALLWREIAELLLFNNQTAFNNPAAFDNPARNETATNPIWRLSLPPTAAWEVVSNLEKLAAIDYMFDQAGGALWLSCPEDLSGEQIRATLLPHGGHGTLWRASQSQRQQVAVFQPQAEVLAALTRRVKHSFDPQGVLNPGRMYKDI